MPEGGPDERYLFLSDVLPTAWQAVDYAAIPKGGSVAVFGLGPIGQMSARIARHQDPLGVDDLTTHQLPLAEAPSAYEMFQKKEDGAIKVVLKP